MFFAFPIKFPLLLPLQSLCNISQQASWQAQATSQPVASPPCESQLPVSTLLRTTSFQAHVHCDITIIPMGPPISVRTWPRIFFWRVWQIERVWDFIIWRCSYWAIHGGNFLRKDCFRNKLEEIETSGQLWSFSSVWECLLPIVFKWQEQQKAFW